MSAHTEISSLEARHLQKSYGSRQVVFDVSVQVRKGEVVGLLGPNGAGKTTSFYMIVGLVRTDGGQILIDGEDVTRMPIHRRARMGLSYLPQEASIFRKLTVAENVRAVLELQLNADGKPLNDSEINSRLQALLKDLRVDHLHDSPSLALSGGERRRVEIARALATDPRFILLDEPFAGIDPIAVIEILERARHWRSHHRSQCARNTRHLRPRLHHQRRSRAGPRHTARHREQCRCTPRLPRRTLPNVMAKTI